MAYINSTNLAVYEYNQAASQFLIGLGSQSFCNSIMNNSFSTTIEWSIAENNSSNSLNGAIEFSDVISGQADPLRQYLDGNNEYISTIDQGGNCSLNIMITGNPDTSNYSYECFG